MISQGDAIPQSDIASVVVKHRSWLHNFIRKRVSSSEDAEDILQEVFYQLVKMDTMETPVEHITAWLFRVARNKIINWQSKKKEEPLSVFYGKTDEDEIIFRDFSDILFGQQSDATPEMEYLRSLIWGEIESALAELSVEQRYIFEHTEFLGIPVKEISAVTGVPVNTLLSRKHYAVLHLRKRLKNLYLELMAQ